MPKTSDGDFGEKFDWISNIFDTPNSLYSRRININA